ncbi:MAG: hypothetical protein KatS3mg010_1021 [Acidimicrobiia bacterium]|nr:MAG: hypothetical protein KatS3mg010_1021 [Acidimicrobiia bacterium]
MMSAIDVGPVAAPPSAASTRSTTSAGALHANAQAKVRTANVEKPRRYTRRWPCTSPSFPNIGIAIASVSSGPLTTQVSTLSLAPRSSAIFGIDTASTVMVKPAANIPVRDATSTHVW